MAVLGILAVAYGGYNILASSTFSDATGAHRRFDCTQAIDGYDRFLGFYALAITSDGGTASRGRSECRLILRAEEAAQDKRHGLAAADYREIVRAYPRSIVLPVLRRRRAEELVRAGDVLVGGAAERSDAVARAAITYQTVIVEGFNRRAAAMATERIHGLLNLVHAESSCRAAEHLAQDRHRAHVHDCETQALGRTARSELPTYLYACGETHFKAGRYRQALPYFQRVSHDFKGTRTARPAELTDLDRGRDHPRRPDECASPAPAPTGTAPRGEVDLVVRNSSPYKLELLLAGNTPVGSLFPPATTA